MAIKRRTGGEKRMFEGSMVALVTPMDAQGAVDNAALAQLVEWHVASGTDALVAVGTTGESATLDFDEHIAVIRRIIELSNGRIPVIAGTGANSTAEAERLTHAAIEAGADACLLVVPYYNKPTQEGLLRHYTHLAERCPIPQILYNVPGRTSCDMHPDTVARLAELDHIIGIKEASSLERLHQLLKTCPPDFRIYTGEDALAAQAIIDGIHGVISVTANVAPGAMHRMCAALRAGNVDQGLAIDRALQPLHKALFLESNPIPVKWALQHMGRIGPGLRLPLTPLSTPHHAALEQAITAAANAP